MSWMNALAGAYHTACERHPGEKLMLVADIDGTILDMRYLVTSVLQEYDQAHGTAYFTRLKPTDIEVHENHVERLLERLHIPQDTRPAMMAWYLDRRWKEDAILNSHRPFPGVLPMIRWFQLQPNTTVGLLTGRPETLRAETLRSLNRAGEPHRVVFDNDVLLMNPGEWEQGVDNAKVAGLRKFRQMGYHVFAVIDNEPHVLTALAEAGNETELLLLHADTIFESRTSSMPGDIVQGRNYALSELVPSEEALPHRVQLVWHGVNDPANLKQFIASGVYWAEIDVRDDPSGEFILRHDSFETTPALPDEEWLIYDNAVSELAGSNVGIKFDIKGETNVLDQVLASVATLQLPDDRLWFNGDIGSIGEAGFRRIRAAHPSAIVQCPIGWLTPLIEAAPDEAHRILKLLVDWGMSRFSVDWMSSSARAVLETLADWGYEVNFYGVPDLEGFLEAVVLLPCSVTSDFNFPQWHFYGLGSGQNGHRFTYAIETDSDHD
jgi:phosphoglycolate phosphatase-like HAD superfamily hydrolase